LLGLESAQLSSGSYRTIQAITVVNANDDQHNHRYRDQRLDGHPVRCSAVVR
jgi:hypothetical protein